ncbi:MAG: extracellular solute-binding protein, partial [Candidatus Niyogibacteria bacterium]|nr:extracellular solute-binding protein [Candidatus Niyogibacteria bacterium]
MKLQYIIIAGSIALAVVALLLFTGVIPGFRSGTPSQSGEIAMWGPLPQNYLAPALTDFQNRFQNIRITYREMRSDTYMNALVDAFASGRGPDIFLLPSDQIEKQKERLFVLTSDIYPLRAFRDGFLDSGDIFTAPEGILALPFTTDPLVLYWNRDLFQSAGLAQPPSTWDVFSTDATKLKTLSGATITQAGAALGEFSNIADAKDILSLLMLQTGNPVVNRTTRKAVFAERADGLTAGEEAVLFFNSFSDPRKTSYTWNRTLPEALEAFSAGTLAMYIGFASDLDAILAKNPHLNFDIAEVPQIAGGPIKATYARSYGLAVSKQSRLPAVALTVMYDLTSFNQQKLLAETGITPPVLRTLLSNPPENPALETFYASAIKARTWLDPDPERTRSIFQEMAGSVLSGATRLDTAVRNAQNQINALFPQTQ